MPLRLHPLHSMRARPPRRPRVASYQPLEGCRFPIGDRAGSTSPRRSSVNASGGLDVWRSATGDRDPTHPRRALHPPPRRKWAPVSSVNTMLHGVRGFLRYAHIDGLTGADPAGLRPVAKGSTPMRPVLGGWTGWNSSGSRPSGIEPGPAAAPCGWWALTRVLFQGRLDVALSPRTMRPSRGR